MLSVLSYISSVSAKTLLIFLLFYKTDNLFFFVSENYQNFAVNGPENRKTNIYNFSVVNFTTVNSHLFHKLNV